MFVRNINGLAKHGMKIDSKQRLNLIPKPKEKMVRYVLTCCLS